VTESDMTPEQWQRVRVLFKAASKMSDAERAAYLRVECADDQALFDEVMALMVSDEIGEDHLHAAIQSVADSLTGTDSDSNVGHEDIGPYRIVDTLGRGGMGTVYLAERADQHFQHRVAIKVLDQHRSSPDLVARFRQERQILANLDHPNIAKLFDGGETADGLPYLVMEHIDGLPITEYCDQKHLTTRARLELMESVCKAVQFAHQNLVIHRDIKPSNILVTKSGIPKLLDFGIAKLMRPEDMQHTIAVTVSSARMLTPGNASPEQVRGETVTTATDVYSLGVLLYQLLTGQFPYEITSYRPADLEKIICDSIPTRPSNRFDLKSGTGTMDSIEENSQLRAATPARLTKQLRGDLDNIVLVAMRKEAERRYATVRQLQQDIGNYLQHRPVLARRESLGYLTSKFVRRNRWAVAAGMAFLAVVIGLTSFYTVQLAEQRDHAQLEAAKAQEVATFLTDLFTEADPQRSLGKPVSAKQMLDNGAARIKDELTSQPELQAALMATIGESYRNMSDLNAAREHLENALQVSEPALGVTHPDVLKMRYLLGITTSFVGNFDDALALHQPDYDYLVTRYGQRSIEAATMLHQIAFVESKTGLHEQSEHHFLELIDIFRNHGDAGRAQLATGLMEYGALLSEMSRLDENGIVLLEAVDIRRQLFGAEHPKYAAVINNLGNFYFRMGQNDNAGRIMQENVQLNRTLYGETSLPYAVAINNYSNLLGRLGDHEGSLALMFEVEAIYLVGYGADSPRYAYSQENIANTLADLDRGAEAEPYYKTALAILAELFGTEHIEYAITQSSYGGYLNSVKRFDEAELELDRVVAVFQKSLGPENYRTLSAGNKRGRALHALGRSDEALAILIPSAAIVRANEALGPRFRIQTLDQLGRVYHGTGRFEEAAPVFAEAIGIWEGSGAAENPVHFDTEYAFVQTLMSLNRYDEAEASLLKRQQQFTAAFGEEDERTLQVATALEELYQERSRNAEN